MRRSLVRALMMGLAVMMAGCVPNPGSLTGDPLDPEPHRSQIVAIDAVLFEDGPIDDHGRESVANALLTLAAAAQSDVKNTVALVHGKELRTLAANARRTAAGATLSGPQLRQQWFRIRTSLFHDARWFRRSSADPIAHARDDVSRLMPSR